MTEPERRQLFYETLRMIGVPLFAMAFRYRSYFCRRMPPAGGVLVVANHQSFLDPVYVGMGTRRPINYMARASLFGGPWLFAKLIRSLNAFPVRRASADLTAMRHAIDLLRAGRAVLIFPEGTRTPDGRLGELQGGFTMLARRSGAVVLPVVIEGASEAWPRTAKLPHAGAVQVAFCEPIPADQIADRPPAWVVERISDRMLAMQQRLRRMHGKRPLDYSQGRWTFREVVRRFGRPGDAEGRQAAPSGTGSGNG